jgi:hypothetical protein
VRARWIVSLAVVLTACAGQPPASGASTLHARGLLVGPTEPITVTFPDGISGVELRPDFEPMDASLRICPLNGRDAVIDGCLEDVAWGVRTPIRRPNLYSLRIASDRAVELSFTAEYFHRGAARDIRVELARTPAAASASACRDNACRVVFEMTPVGVDEVSAFATFSGGDGEVLVLEGRVLARAETATGLPYREAAASRGPSHLRAIAAIDDPHAEYAIVIGEVAGPGADGLRDVELSMTWF